MEGSGATGTSFLPSTCGENVGPLIREGSRSNMRSISVRPFDEGGHRLRGPHNQGTHECKSNDESIDGIGAYMCQSAFLKKLHSVPSLHWLLPFVRATYSDPIVTCGRMKVVCGTASSKLKGRARILSCHCCLTWRSTTRSLEEASRELRPEEHLFAYLQCVFLFRRPKVKPHIVRQSWRKVVHEIAHRQDTTCGIPGVRGRGHQQAIEGRAQVGCNPISPDLQATWQILIQCAGPRCHHIFRTLPPSQSAEYAQRHDD